jgi:2-methylisocitrate lyase-like PEP mutase family enzyme
VPIVLNGRTDVFLRQPADTPAASLVAEAIRRGRLYLEAGADCVFPIGVGDEASISALLSGLSGPINVIAGFRGAPGQARLAELGVRRISYAGRLQRAMQTDLEQRLAAISRGEDL